MPIAFPPPPGAWRTLFAGRGLALNSTADQKLTKLGSFSRYAISDVWVTNASGIPVLAAGGLYTAASKGGIALVGTGQLYTALWPLVSGGLTPALDLDFVNDRVWLSDLPANAAVLPLTLLDGIAAMALTAPALYFALTTANAEAVTVDVAVGGIDLS